MSDLRLGKTQEVMLYQLGGQIDDAWNLLRAGIDGSACDFINSTLYGNELDCGNKPPAYVVSVSYGFYEDPAIQQQACAEFGKVRTRVSVRTTLIQQLAHHPIV